MAARSVGVRELKARTSELLRQVREDGASFVITRHGRPAGLLTPLSPRGHGGGSIETESAAEVLTALDDLAARVEGEWREERTSADLLSDLRR